MFHPGLFNGKPTPWNKSVCVLLHGFAEGWVSWCEIMRNLPFQESSRLTSPDQNPANSGFRLADLGGKAHYLLIWAMTSYDISIGRLIRFNLHGWQWKILQLPMEWSGSAEVRPHPYDPQWLGCRRFPRSALSSTATPKARHDGHVGLNKPCPQSPGIYRWYGINLPFPVMGRLWDCFAHVIYDSPYLFVQFFGPKKPPVAARPQHCRGHAAFRHLPGREEQWTREASRNEARDFEADSWWFLLGYSGYSVRFSSEGLELVWILVIFLGYSHIFTYCPNEKSSTPHSSWAPEMWIWYDWMRFHGKRWEMDDIWKYVVGVLRV